MSRFFVDPCPGDARLVEAVERLSILRQVLRQAIMGQHPTREALTSFPRLTKWQLTHAPETALSGFFEGHPRIDDGDLGVTSAIWVLAPELGFCRTTSRTYRLVHRA